jgi:hypothetical protein
VMKYPDQELGPTADPGQEPESAGKQAAEIGQNRPDCCSVRFDGLRMQFRSLRCRLPSAGIG